MGRLCQSQRVTFRAKCLPFGAKRLPRTLPAPILRNSKVLLEMDKTLHKQRQYEGNVHKMPVRLSLCIDNMGTSAPTNSLQNFGEGIPNLPRCGLRDTKILFSEKSLDTPAISWILATRRSKRPDTDSRKQQTGQTLTAQKMGGVPSKTYAFFKAELFGSCWRRRGEGPGKRSETDRAYEQAHQTVRKRGGGA
jgi:hypothetical protein